jgi:teichuronic acid biosynthesis glycosyltransferase TuaG
MNPHSKPFADVSVVIPAYRAAATIGRALESVVCQTLPPLEIIVVDDGSEDGTYEIAESYENKLTDIPLKLFRQPNGGAGRARNKAIQEASGKYIAFLDADDEWLPEKTAKSMAYFEKQDYVLIAHNGWIVDGDTQLLNDCCQRFQSRSDPFISLYKKGYIDTCTVIARREAILAVGGFDESLPNAQDFELWLALCAPPGSQFIVFDEVLSRYHLMPGSIMSHTKRRLDCCLEIAKRYSPEIKKRGRAGLLTLWYRIAAVHYEAFSAFLSKNNFLEAGLVPIKMIFSLFSLSVSYWQNNKFTRPHI